MPFLSTIGPKSTSSTTTGTLKSGFDSVIGNILDNLNSLKSSSETVQSTTASISSSMDSAVPNVQQIQDNFNSFGESYLNLTDSSGDYTDLIRLVFIILYSVMIGLVGLAVLGLILVKVCKMQCCRCLNHLGWCCMGWLLILTLLLGIIFWMLGLTLSDSCFAFDKLVTPTELNSIDRIKDSAQYVAPCLDTSTTPSMADTLAIRTQVDDINSVDTQLDAYNNRGLTGTLSSSDFTALNTLISTVRYIKVDR